LTILLVGNESQNVNGENHTDYVDTVDTG
jgi:hypothetical protein